MNEAILFLRLFYEFFKTGLFSIGGGLATIPFLQDIARRTGWYTEHQLADMIAVAESTPGPIGINTATYVGFTVGGVPGGIIATLGLVAPSIIVITIIAYILKKFENNRYVKYTFYFLRAASLALICVAGYSFAKLALFDSGAVIPQAVILAAVCFILMQFVKPFKKLHPIVWIGISAVCGIVFF